MKDFKQFITEASAKSAVFTFGRFNPPTTGHELLVNKLVKEGRGYNDIFLFTSHSQDKKKNPLSYRDKTNFLRNFFGNKVSVPDSPARNVFDIAVYLYDNGFTTVKMVVGSDRVREFKTLLNKYNGVDARHGFYEFDRIDVVSAGERDPDAADVSGMSASKMRAFAMEGDFDSFEKGVPSTGRKTQALRLYNAIRKGMGLSEETTMGMLNRLMSKTFGRKEYKKFAVAVRREMDKDKSKRHSAEYYAHKILRQAGADERMDARALAHIARMAEELTEEELNEDVNMKNVDKLKAAARDFDKKKTRKHDNFDSISDALSQIVFSMRRLDTSTSGRTDYKHEKIIDKEIVRINSIINRTNYVKGGATPEGKEIVKLLNKHGLNGPRGFSKVIFEDVEINEVAQDPDVKDKEGTQPKKYYSGLDKKTKAKRDAHFKKGAAMDDDNPNAYKPAPGDKDAKTKTSKHTKKYHDMYGEEFEEVTEDANTALKKKADKSGISLSILKQVYKRGVAAWRTGHRPGTTPEQWGHARVNSFITKGKGTWGKADKDLAQKVKG